MFYASLGECSYMHDIFFLMIRRPPRSTLFPYTTALPISLGRRARKSCTSSPTTLSIYPILPCARVSPGPDRKSTRLNSSHANIPYAVFCLKKKNTYFFFNLQRHHQSTANIP